MEAGAVLGAMTLLTAILTIALVIGMMQMNAEKLEREHLETINDLRTALDEIKTLRGILPICSYCNKIRDDDGQWNRIESYIAKYSEAQFSHGICQECADKHYPDMNLYADHKTTSPCRVNPTKGLL
jgi:thioredoxin-related protein